MADPSDSGALSPAQLREWLQRRAPLTACCEALVSEQDWCTAALARLLLLHGRRGRVLVKDLAGSPDALELAMVLHGLEAAETAAAAAIAAAESDGGNGSTGGAAANPAPPLASAAQQQQGWFAPASVAGLRARFAELDADGDGLLTQLEFSRCCHARTLMAHGDKLLPCVCG